MTIATLSVRLRKFVGCLLFLLAASPAWSQAYDLIIKNGHVIDPRNQIDGIMDVAIRDKRIAAVARNIDGTATKTIDATGLFVTPGLIDIHGHYFFGTEEDAYLSNSYTAVQPDAFTFRSGVTTTVDAGCPGWRNFSVYKAQTIAHSKTRILVFLNIVGAGMRGGQYEQNLNDMDAEATARVALENKDHVVGIKLAHFNGHQWAPTERAVQAGTLAGLPVMIDFGGAEPELALDTLFLHKLRPGDIFTHCYAQVKKRTSIVHEGKLRPYVIEAQQRGIVFDVGHGGGSFVFDQAIPAIAQGLKPNSISTDLHAGSMNAGMKDMINVMSKMLHCGLTLTEVIERSTWNPARIVGRPELGNLSVGAPADVAVLRLEKGNFGFTDVAGDKVSGNERLAAEVTVLAGEVVWDLNGLSAKPYAKAKK